MQLASNTLRMVAKATAADLQCCAHSAAVLFVIQTQIMECMYVKDCSSTIVLQLSRPELHHREQHRNRRPEDQRKNRRAAREQQKSNSRTAVKKQRDSSSFNFVLRCARQHRRHRCTWLVTPNVQMIRIIASDPQRASSSSSSSISSISNMDSGGMS